MRFIELFLMGIGFWLISFLQNYFSFTKPNGRFSGSYMQLPLWIFILYGYPKIKKLPRGIISLRGFIGMNYAYACILFSFLPGRWIFKNALTLVGCLCLSIIVINIVAYFVHKKCAYKVENQEDLLTTTKGNSI